MGALETFDFGLAACTVGLREQVREAGAFYARHPLFPPERCEAAVAAARRFFALPEEEKRALAIERSRHFRGYSEMRNERDWREQIHFGREEAPVESGAEYDQLRGPNLWPEDAEWKRDLLRLMDDLETVGREIMQCLCYFSAEEQSYLLLKLIHYGESPDGVARPGVAAHVDFSWITLLLQDDAGGLEVRTPAGEWVEATPRPGTLVVNIGEILQLSTGGEFVATPHRVTTGARSRVSMPFFLNPALDTVIPPGRGAAVADRGPHVHRVFTAMPKDPVVFGEAEWERKGRGIWCRECCQISK